jgi:hypothetical protein
MNSVETQKKFDQARAALCKEHSLNTESVLPRDLAFEALMERFFDGTLEVTLETSWRNDSGELNTISIHRNSTGKLLLAHDSAQGRRYHFPASWMGSRSQSTISDIEINAWSRFSNTPSGRPTGYKQQRFSRTPELYFRGDRIVAIDGRDISDVHTGKALYRALQDAPGSISLTLESR